MHGTNVEEKKKNTNIF